MWAPSAGGVNEGGDRRVRGAGNGRRRASWEETAGRRASRWPSHPDRCIWVSNIYYMNIEILGGAQITE